MPLGHGHKQEVLNVITNDSKSMYYKMDNRVVDERGVSPQYYYRTDLYIGAKLNVYNRVIVLVSCDEFTKQFYRTVYGLSELTVHVSFYTKRVYITGGMYNLGRYLRAFYGTTEIRGGSGSRERGEGRFYMTTGAADSVTSPTLFNRGGNDYPNCFFGNLLSV